MSSDSSGSSWLGRAAPYPIGLGLLLLLVVLLLLLVGVAECRSGPYPPLFQIQNLKV